MKGSKQEQFDQKRRAFIKTGAAFPLLFLVACASSPKKIGPIEVDVSNVKDIPSLIAAIKKAGGKLLPESLKDEEFYEKFAGIFVKNARAAADLGYKIPQWVLDKLPHKKSVALPVLGVAVFAVAGVMFAVPVSTLIISVLASIVLMMYAIGAAITAIFADEPHKT